MSDENKKYVPEGVFLVCDMGATPSQLYANPRKVNLYGPMIATDADNKYTMNVLPFGVCKTLGAPCTFACVEWTKTKSGNVFANGEKPLLEDSEAICTVGSGKIKIFFDKYEADLANENNNESAFASEEISSNIIGQILTFPTGNLVDLLSDDDEKFIEGVGRGFKKGMEGTWNFLSRDMWKADTWKGLGKMAVIGAAYSGPTGMIMGDNTLRSMDATLGTDFIPTRDALVEGVSNAASNAWQDVERGNTGEVGESVGQIYYAVIEAVVGTKGAGLVVKGLSTGAKALIGVERLALLSAKISKFANALKQGILSVVKVGKKPKIVTNLLDDLLKLKKPSNSPDLKKWINEKGGKVEVLDDGAWRYTDWEGNVVNYRNGHPDFGPHSRQSVDIGNQRGDYYHDYKNAEINSKEIPPKLPNNETTWHHHEDGKRMIEVDKKIHDRFTHNGGVSKTKKAKLGKK